MGLRGMGPERGVACGGVSAEFSNYILIDFKKYERNRRQSEASICYEANICFEVNIPFLSNSYREKKLYLL
jgi:hypothetical protein